MSARMKPVRRAFWVWSALAIISFAGQAQWSHTFDDNSSVSVLAATVTRIYAGAYGRILVSTDGGSTWTGKSAGYPTDVYTNGLAVAGDIVFAGNSNGVFRSTDYGDNWELVYQGSPVHCMLAKGAFVFANTEDNILRSSDFGNTWIAPTGGSPSLWTNCLAADGSAIYAGGFGSESTRVYKSTDDGDNWQPTGPLPETIITMTIVRGTLLACGQGTGIWRSTDQGASWIDPIGDSFRIDLTTSETVGTYAFLGGEGGLYVSLDEGRSGCSAFSGSAVADICSRGESLVLATSDGIWKNSLRNVVLDASKDQWVGAYVPGYKPFPLSGIDFSKVSHVIDFVVLPTSEGGINYMSNGISSTRSAQLRSLADAAGKKILFSVGGQETGRLFLDALSAPAASFVDTLVRFLKERKYDGIDIDWEPTGSNDNTSIKENGAIFQNFITELKTKIGPGKLITVAARGGDEGIYASLEENIDLFHIMAYDCAGTWMNITWHDAPLHTLSDGALSKWAITSIDQIISGYLQAGIPATKLLVGIPLYGKVYRGASEPLQSWDTQAGIAALSFDDIKNSYSSVYNDHSIHRWDDKASASYLSLDDQQNSSNKRFISFDDENSVALKVQYARENGFGGVFVFELSEGSSLLGVISQAKEGNSFSPFADVSLPVSHLGWYEFRDPSGSGTFLRLDVKACEGTGLISVRKQLDPPSHPGFQSVPPKSYSAYRWVISQSGLSSITADIHFDISKLPNAIANPSALRVYKRPAEGAGLFMAVPTSYDAASNNIIASVQSFSEFIIGSDDNSLSAVASSLVSPLDFRLSQNFPNPFNPTTTIQYALPKASNVRITVYDLLGRCIRTLVNEMKQSGSYATLFDGSNLASGVYFYRLEAGSFVQTRRLCIIR
jgi:GH18 family chitinase